MTNAHVSNAIDALAAGRMVIVIDDADRENEGDFVFAASLATAQSIAFLLEHASGYICAAMSGAALDELAIPLMVQQNTAPLGTAMTVTVDAIRGTTTGISSADRARTLQCLADPNSKPEDFARPGHIQPLRAADGGVLERRGHTEAAVDLMRLAALPLIAGIAEIVSADKLTMARELELIALARRYDMAMISIDDLVSYRLQNERLLEVHT